jgi:hypothetical protein
MTGRFCAAALCSFEEAQPDRATLHLARNRSRHMRAFPRAAVTWAPSPAGVTSIGNDHAIRPAVRWRRRFGFDGVHLAHHLEARERAIDPASTVHVLDELAETLGLGLGGSDDHIGLVERARAAARRSD